MSILRLSLEYSIEDAALLAACKKNCTRNSSKACVLCEFESVGNMFCWSFQCIVASIKNLLVVVDGILHFALNLCKEIFSC